ncbi:MAG TPA: SDR family NAD(P)-dependent oxidoreductase [Longimicrobiaceae bacterium]|nr:SDR family NAD(P)-dependent oxidoreductase [Longimicrobiaceae bacterium]
MDSIAIVGLSGRFPGASNVDEFWSNLREGVESITHFSDEELDRVAIDPAELADPGYVKARGVLENVEGFDAAFFDFTPREAQITDPQHRLFIECAWEALETAGYNPKAYDGSIGVFAGAGANSYMLFNLSSAGELTGTIDTFQAFIHNKNDHLTTRVAYKLDLRGPCVTVQTACSTSLVATALACQSLMSYQCDMALAGGVNVFVPQKTGYLHHEGGIGSPDGRCRPFDASAAGTLGGNGAGVVVLKRYEDAIADGDTIHAVIRGWGVNNDGSVKVGYTAPGVDSQAEVISTAQVFADVPAETITYVEAHGTGTAIGDPIEVQALTRAFRRETDRSGFCALGSVKSNIGHLDAAAGVAGLIKTVQALRHRQIPPSLHFEEPNPRIDFASTPFYVASRLTPWETGGAPRRAGVSSFGLGGTNAHLVLEEAPAAEEPAPARDRQLLVISGQSAAAMEAATQRLVEHLKAHPEQSLADVAYTLQVGRASFEHRRMLVCRDRDEAVSMLEALTPERVVTRSQVPVRRPLTFMFPGQGAQYPGMGSGLYETEPVFRAEVDRCLELVQPHLDFDLRALLFADTDDAEAAAAMGRTAATQPALFIVEYALARLWMSWGVKPDSMIGHSIGEYVAAALAGVMSLEDALKLVAARGALIQALPGGAMLGVPLSERKVRAMLGGDLSLAAVNGDELCVVSGTREAVDAFAAKLEELGVTGRPLHTSHAFHSAMMEPMLDAFRAKVREVKLSAPELPYLSNVTGTWITAGDAVDPEYYVRHIRQTVRFHDGISELVGDPNAALLEVGPGRTLRSVVRWHPKKLPGQVMHASLPHAKERNDDREFILNTVGQLWLAGVEIDWKALYAGERRRRVPLPTYPFQRKRYWIDMQAGGRRAAAKSLAKKQDVGDWFWVPTWKESPAPVADASVAADEGTWLLFSGEGGISSAVADRLAKAGRSVVTVRAGYGFRELAQGSYEIDPRRREDYGALLARLAGSGKLPRRVVHLWNVVSGPGDVLDRSLHSLLFLAQAIGERGTTDPISLTVVTGGMQEVTGGDLSNPEQSVVLGPVRVIPREYGHVACRSVDVVLPAPGSWQEEKLVGQLVAEAASDGADTVVALRSGHRWVQDFDPVKLPPVADTIPVVREGGVYLITGGLGGIGLQVAEHLARTARAKLVLTGRSEFPARAEWDAWVASHEATEATSRKIQALKALEALGAEVLVGAADVADEAAMRAVVDRARAKWGEIHGVVHAAGVPSGGLVQMKTPEQVAQVLAPKVQGTRVLERIFAGDRLDFVVLCSSRTSVMGRFGQVDYTAANAFLDAFARYYRQKTGTYTVSVNWGAWEEVGMAAVNHGPASKEATTTVIRTYDHPLLERLIVDEPGRQVFATDFSIEKHWPIDEHRIIGNAVMPGVTYFEMLRAALQERAGDRVVTIRESFFVEPMHLKDGEVREGRLEIRDEGPDEFSFQIWSWDGNNPSGRIRKHAMGRVGIDDRQPAQKNDLQAVIARCPEQATILQEEREDDLGPRWQSIHRLHLGKNELVLELELPEAFESDWEKWVFHPAILDRAAGITKVFLAREGYYLPLIYRGIPLARPLSGKLYSHGRFHEEESGDRDTIVFDFNLMDENGDTVLRVEKFTQKRVNDPGAEIRNLADAGASLEFGEKAGAAGDGILPREGVDAFARILAARMEPQVVVSPNDLHAAIEQSDAQVSDAILESLESRGSDAPRSARPDLSSEYVAPRNEIERRIARVWGEVLGVEQVGVHDNFFELGGDSVQAIQIMAKGKQAGLHLTPQQFFQYETIAELAQMIGEVLEEEAQHGAVIGEVPLAPAQRWHLERTGGRGYAAQAVLLEARRRLDAGHLGEAVRHVLAHHDALRLQFTPEGGEWKQVSATAGEDLPFETIAVEEIPATERVDAARTQAERIAAGFDLAVGPLLHVALLDAGADAPQLLLVVAHDLVADAPSWPLLLEDLATVYGQVARAQEVRLPAKTVSFKAWSEAAGKLVGSDALAREAAFWREEVPAEGSTLPRDREPAGATVEATAQVVVSAIDAELAREAAEEVTQARRAEADEVLLAALVQTLAEWAGSRSALVDVAYDARGGEAGDADYSRTVGWMEHLVPVRVEADSFDPVATLKAVKQRVRHLAGHAEGYGVLRHLAGGHEVGEMLRSAPQAEVGFRYVDLSAGLVSQFGPWEAVDGAAFPLRGGDVPRAHLVEVEAVRGDDGVRVRWAFSPEVHDRATAERLAASFEASLRALVERSRTAQPEGFTPEDFPLANLDAATLGQLSALIRRADQGV